MISEEVKREYRDCLGWAPILCCALRDTLAQLRKAEWLRLHTRGVKGFCGGCASNPEWAPHGDPRHDWTLEQWKSTADKELLGE
jgi:hypothetical protein